VNRWAFDGRKNLYAPTNLMGPSPDAPISRVFHVKVLSEDSERPQPYQARQPLHPSVCASLVCVACSARRALGCSMRTPCASKAARRCEHESSASQT
jgi:hypothetical protein